VVEPELRGGRGGLVRVTAEHHHLDVSRAAYAAAWAWPNPVPNRAIFMIIVPFELDGYMVRSVRSSAATEGVDLGDIGGAQSDLEGVVILRDPIGVN